MPGVYDKGRGWRSRSTWKYNERVVRSLNDTCAICGHFCDTSLPAKLPLSPEVDHIIPVIRGGDPTGIENLCLVHKYCNQVKGTKLLSEMDMRNFMCPCVSYLKNRGRKRSWSEEVSDGEK